MIQHNAHHFSFASTFLAIKDRHRCKLLNDLFSPVHNTERLGSAYLLGLFTYIPAPWIFRSLQLERLEDDVVGTSIVSTFSAIESLTLRTGCSTMRPESSGNLMLSRRKRSGPNAPQTCPACLRYNCCCFLLLRQKIRQPWPLAKSRKASEE